MDFGLTFAFVVFPYLTLTTFVVGHAYRYLKDPYRWNARSSELLDKEGLKYGVTLFHWGILLTLVGHAGGLLIPQRLYDLVGIDGQMHTQIAYGSGLVVGVAAVVGLVLLVRRRLTVSRIRVTTRASDVVMLGLLLFASGAGLYNVLFGHYYVLDSIAPWIRGILILKPDPSLMREVPFSYKVHILSALALLGVSPFTRLIHIWSAPFGYLFRSYILFRRYRTDH